MNVLILRRKNGELPLMDTEQGGGEKGKQTMKQWMERKEAEIIHEMENKKKIKKLKHKLDTSFF